MNLRKLKNSRIVIYGVLFVSLIFNISGAYGQKNPTNEEIIAEINEQVWKCFCEAYDSLDVLKMKDIHHVDLIRVSADNKRVLNYTDYMKSIEAFYQTSKTRGIKLTIELRFKERLNSANTASERGIYKLTVLNGFEENKYYYGEFHVLLKKMNGKWLIWSDYDSSENGTVDEKSYNSLSERKNLE